MPRVKSNPQKRNCSTERTDSGVLPADEHSRSSYNENDSKPRKKRFQYAPKQLSAGKVKSVSTANLTVHRKCGTNAEFSLDAFHSFIRLHKTTEKKYFIGNVMFSLNDDLDADTLKTMHGIYVGEGVLAILFLKEDSDNGVVEHYCMTTSVTPSEIWSSLVTDSFIVECPDIDENSKDFVCNVMLGSKSFVKSDFPSEYPKGGIHRNVKKVMEFFYDDLKMEELPEPVEDRHQYLSNFFDNVVHKNKSDKDVQHPSLVPELRPYQTDAVRWMLRMEKSSGYETSDDPKLHPLFTKFTTLDGEDMFYNKFAGFFTLEAKYQVPIKGGILADEMGLGKTVEVLACILNNPRKMTKSDSVAEYIKRAAKKRTPRAKEAANGLFSCYCGETEYDENDPDIVICHKCGVPQHGKCFNFTANSVNQTYFCPHCWTLRDMELIPSGATLIVLPERICYQWEEEILKHIRNQSLKILVYKGLTHHKFIQPTDLAQYDIVLTTYEVLGREIRYVNLPYGGPERRALRQPQKFYFPPSPLTTVMWWRVCLDEAQMAEYTTTNTVKMALQLSCVNRWCVSGTPLLKNHDDLYGLFQFLGHDPFSVHFWWKEAIYLPYCNGNPNPLTRALKPIVWRTMIKNVRDQLGIPQRDTVVHWETFSPVEEFFYSERHLSCNWKINALLLSADLNTQLASLDLENFYKIWIPVQEMRQACCHPQVVKGQFVSIQRSFLTMSEVLNVLIKKAKYNAEETHRELVAALNGLAGIYFVLMKYNEAEDHYKKSLNSAHVHRETVRTDSLQTYHAFHNLSELVKVKSSSESSAFIIDDEDDTENKENVLVVPAVSTSGNSAVHPALGTPLNSAKLLVEANKYKSVYLEKTSMAAVSASSNLEKVKKEVGRLNALINTSSPWWLTICHQAQTTDNNCAFIDKLKIDLAASSVLEITIANRFADIMGLSLVVYNLISDLKNARENLKVALQTLPRKPSESDVLSAAACHLRPIPKRRTRATKCQYCKTEGYFDQYESRLFQSSKKKNKTRTAVAHQAAASSSARDNYDSPDTDDDDVTGNEGTWADCELVKVFKSLIQWGRTCQVETQLIDKGHQTLQWMTALKREFRLMRNFWMKSMDHVSALDELRMASLRYQLKFPNDPVDESSAGCVLMIDQVEVTKYRLENEEAIARKKFKDQMHKVHYLKNLKIAETQCGENGERGCCIVCQQKFRSTWSVLPCGHSVCNECVVNLMGNCPLDTRHLWFKCPICREEVCYTDILCIGKKIENPLAEEFPVEGSYSTKICDIVRCLLQIQRDEPMAKSLVFSEWPTLLRIMMSALARNGIQAVFPNHKTRLEDELKKFKTDPRITAALMPIQSCSSGLNITEATHVLLVEPVMRPSLELQAIGRVYRIGQTKKTTIHHFIMKGSVEENIYKFFSPDDAVKDIEKETTLTLRDIQSLF